MKNVSVSVFEPLHMSEPVPDKLLHYFLCFVWEENTWLSKSCNQLRLLAVCSRPHLHQCNTAQPGDKLGACCVSLFTQGRVAYCVYSKATTFDCFISLPLAMKVRPTLRRCGGRCDTLRKHCADSSSRTKHFMAWLEFFLSRGTVHIKL